MISALALQSSLPGVPIELFNATEIICTVGLLEPNPCVYDWGAPLFANFHGTFDYVQIGITSYSTGCLDFHRGEPAIYQATNSDVVLKFINEIASSVNETVEFVDGVAFVPTFAPNTGTPTVSPATFVPTLQDVDFEESECLVEENAILLWSTISRTFAPAVAQCEANGAKLARIDTLNLM